VRFGVEMNISLAACTPESGRLFILGENRKREIGLQRVEDPAVSGLLIRDVTNEVSITLSSATPFLFWSIPLETVSRCPGGDERIFQSHCFVAVWDIELAAGASWQNHLSVGFEKTPAP
jgi:hypothetical protein